MMNLYIPVLCNTNKQYICYEKQISQVLLIKYYSEVTEHGNTKFGSPSRSDMFVLTGTTLQKQYAVNYPYDLNH